MSSAKFEPTKWTLIDLTRQSPEALNQICQIYWKPIYAFLRASGSNPQEAEDLTQGFFAHALAKGIFETADPKKGKLRNYLLSALKHYRSNENRKNNTVKRGGDITFVFINTADGEGQKGLQSEAADLNSPEELYDRSWALTLIARCMQILHEEYSKKNKADLYSAFSPLLTDSKKRGDLAEIAKNFKVSQGTIRLAFGRFKDRFRQIVQEEIAGTIGTMESVDSEMETIQKALTR